MSDDEKSQKRKTNVFLLDRTTREYVGAVLLDPVTREEVEAAERAWRPVMQDAVACMEAQHIAHHERPQHGHWDWRKKYDQTQGILAFQMFGIECQNEIQGLMLVQTAGKMCHIPSQKGKPLVYVYFIASAPWNSPLVVAEPRYGQVGRVLIATAIELSKSMEFAGRIGLHSLPQTESWYAKHCGMTDLGPDQNSRTQNLRYFEMTPEQASTFLT